MCVATTMQVDAHQANAGNTNPITAPQQRTTATPSATKDGSNIPDFSIATMIGNSLAVAVGASTVLLRKPHFEQNLNRSATLDLSQANVDEVDTTSHITVACILALFAMFFCLCMAYALYKKSADHFEQQQSMARFVRWLAHEVRVPANNCLMASLEVVDTLQMQRRLHAMRLLHNEDDAAIQTQLIAVEQENTITYSPASAPPRTAEDVSSTESTNHSKKVRVLDKAIDWFISSQHSVEHIRRVLDSAGRIVSKAAKPASPPGTPVRRQYTKPAVPKATKML